MPLPAVALRFILSNPSVTTVMGMRKPSHVRANLAASDAGALAAAELEARRPFRWVHLKDWP